MSTFIQLVNDVGRESGTMGQQTLGTVTGATGRWLKVVGWTRQAWEMIQRDRTDWTFTRKTFSAPLTIGQDRYSAAQLGITDFGSWRRANENHPRMSLYDPAIGRSDEAWLTRMDYESWADSYDIGITDNNRPTVYTIDDERKLCVGSPPDKAYVLRGSYRRSIQSLTADVDEPFISPDHHQIIVWRALMLLGDDDEAGFEVASSGLQYRLMRDALIAEYTEQVTM